ncbi:MAG: TIGR04283 family arsenosugar biosynthesis glycosyltransferase [Acidobacteria bacterium]|nr:TIGR04283 family arsenosugar biosynthesis glycosyltransferase [Acidobacteriota bacterium]
MPAPLVTVVVPVLHDTPALSALLAWRGDHDDASPAVAWVVVNGDAADASVASLRATHPDVTWLDSAPGRGVQLGEGARRATGRWLLFLHADTRLPREWLQEVTLAARASSYEWGCFQLQLDSAAWQARLIEWAVRLRVRLLRLPYGDQAMFFRRLTLERWGGVPPQPVMEDVALAITFGRRGAPYRSSRRAVTSARRWERDGWWRRSARNLSLLLQYLLGASPDRLSGAYQPERGRPVAAGSTSKER